MINLKSQLSLVLFIISISIFAQNNEIDKKLDQCLETKNSTADQRNCLNTAYTEWDKELNKYYKLLTSKLPSDAKQKLVKSQRNWVTYRDAEFDFNSKFYFGLKQGTINYIIADQAKMNFVKNRALELKDYYTSLQD